MRTKRPRSTIFLIVCGLTLLVSIVAGQRMGDRVLHQTTETAVLPHAATPSVAPTAVTTGAGLVRDWKKAQVVTVATDPGFPDPRVTRPPTATPTPKPTPTPTPVPTPTPTPYVPPTEIPTPNISPTPDVTRPAR